jgi:hypothetical protein
VGVPQRLRERIVARGEFIGERRCRPVTTTSRAVDAAQSLPIGRPADGQQRPGGDHEEGENEDDASEARPVGHDLPEAKPRYRKDAAENAEEQDEARPDAFPQDDQFRPVDRMSESEAVLVGPCRPISVHALAQKPLRVGNSCTAKR